MVKIKQTISMYRSHGEEYDDEDIESLNEALAKLEINCKVMKNSDPDGEELIFMKNE